MTDVVSVRGVGNEWTSLKPNQFPRLFAGGGWQDGVTGIRPDLLNSDANNLETENSIATQLGHGSRMIDQPLARMDTERLANSNPEYNFSQFKSGNQNPGTITENSVQLTTTDDGATSDLILDVDPREHEHADLILQLAGIHNMVTREAIERGNADPNVTWKPHTSNPFAQKKMTVKSDMTSGREFLAPGQAYEYETAAPLYTAQQQRAINNNTATGLRKVNTHKSSGTLMKALDVRKNMYDGIDKVSGSLTEEMGVYDKSFVKDQDALLAPSRFKGANYLASQPGLINVSRSQHNKYRKSKHIGKMQTLLIGS